jgi:hypothetical protein
MARYWRKLQPDSVRSAAFLSVCSPQAAYDWLKARPTEWSSVFGSARTPADAHLLEYILLRRREPLIDCALAEFGRSRTVLGRVFDRNGSAVRAVACGNPSLFDGDTIDTPSGANILDVAHAGEGERVEAPHRPMRRGPYEYDILEAGSEAELIALCQNAHMRSSFYSSVFSFYKNPHRSIPEDRYQRILVHMGGNPRLSLKREDSREANYWDGFARHEYDEVFASAWKLAAEVPPTELWAVTLSRLYQRLLSHPGSDFDVEAVLARWRPKDREQNGLESYATIRECIARLLKPSLTMLASEDEALRHAFYATFDPDSVEFRDLDWIPWLQADPYCSAWLEGNLKVWKSARGREKLFNLLRQQSRRENDVVFLGWAREREEEYRKKHPEWFAVEDGTDEREPTMRDVSGLLAQIQSTLQKRPASRNNVWGSLVSALLLISIGFLMGRA